MRWTTEPVDRRNKVCPFHGSDKWIQARPQCARGSSKRSFITTLGLPSTLICQRNGAFWKTLFKPEEFENAGFWVSCGRETCWTWNFWKRWRQDHHHHHYHILFPARARALASCVLFPAPSFSVLRTRTSFHHIGAVSRRFCCFKPILC